VLGNGLHDNAVVVAILAVRVGMLQLFYSDFNALAFYTPLVVEGEN